MTPTTHKDDTQEKQEIRFSGKDLIEAIMADADVSREKATEFAAKLLRSIQRPISSEETEQLIASAGGGARWLDLLQGAYIDAGDFVDTATPEWANPSWEYAAQKNNPPGVAQAEELLRRATFEVNLRQISLINEEIKAIQEATQILSNKNDAALNDLETSIGMR